MSGLGDVVAERVVSGTAVLFVCGCRVRFLDGCCLGFDVRVGDVVWQVRASWESVVEEV